MNQNPNNENHPKPSPVSAKRQILPYTLPILMYHGVVTPGIDSPQMREEGAQLYDLPLEQFQEHMEWLHKNQYRSLSPAELIEKNSSGSEKRILLTFDDGESNNYHLALPVLLEHELTACFFVTIDRIGQKGYLNWDRIQEMHKLGMTIGSHGLTHSILVGLKMTELEQELCDSRQILEDKLGAAILSISIPRGFYDKTVLAAAEQAGYRYIFVSEYQKMDTLINYFPRIAVKAHWTSKRLSLALSHKTPISERIFNTTKKHIKKVVGIEHYNTLRASLIKKRSKRDSHDNG